MNFLSKIKRTTYKFSYLPLLQEKAEKNFAFLNEELTIQKMLLGKQLANEIKKIKKIKSLGEIEFRVFSQFGDDGIIQYLINKIKIQEKVFVEFGVGNYKESNTRFLLMNNNWSGFVADSSSKNIEELKKENIFWRHDLKAIPFFVTRDNVNSMIKSQGISGEIGLLHIDLDGVDYWIWKELTIVNPTIVILEYNSVFGIKRPVTIPYKKNFDRTKAHYSNLYWGSSLPALYLLSKEKGYSFVGCNSAGNNAYFVRKDKLGSLKSLKPEEGYVLSKYRESRNKNGSLTYLSGEDRLEAIKGMPVFNVLTKRMEKL
ncbi:MAG: hypothetical protein Q8O84_04615 [Nanoarchaeota archaeon]|nr:hypothetical protein [Nanoarchaeota archaeon]